MSYALFIDDERFPPADGRAWVIARTLSDVRDIVNARGAPDFISFDHDLGDAEPTGFDIAKALVEADLDSRDGATPSPGSHGIRFTFGPQVAYTLHSQNPVGAGNIKGLLDAYLGSRENER